MSNIGGYTALFLYDGVSLRLLNPLPKGVSRRAPFTSSGTFTPVGSLVMVQEWAGGAAGRNVGGSSYTAGQGGGAGEYRYGYFQVTPGVGIAVTVGAGAAAGSNGNGGASSFGSLMTALGAIGTAGGAGGSGGYGFSGGAGSPGFSNGNVTGGDRRHRLRRRALSRRPLRRRRAGWRRWSVRQSEWPRRATRFRARIRGGLTNVCIDPKRSGRRAFCGASGFASRRRIG
ncbi:protein of unknown function [Methylocella tundrae]|uniref:Glycine-rich domain-containing protein n=1 Tax=Methylocella tundrae TaxID=227605 RepID=A0A4U8Z009_METTU|nr:protein of unknown function [Methylocella tundrae]